MTDIEPPPGYHFQCKPNAPAPSPLPGQKSAIAKAGNEVCAKVQLRLDQNAVLARDAFKATLELDNDTLSPLQNILVNLEIKDANSTLLNSIFGITPPQLAGLSGIDGT